MSAELERHLQPGGRKRILALDGGGSRGMVSLGLLQHIENVLRARASNHRTFRLCDYFDLIAGTSAGSIIAAGLALGWKVEEVKKEFETFCPKVFGRPNSYGMFSPVHDARELERHLKKALGDADLKSERLRTGLMICAKRIDTGAPWVLTNNPKAKFWESSDKDFRPNQDYELDMIVRASAAAPHYFDPKTVVINEGGARPRQIGLFTDGAMGGHNNPAMQAFLTATLPAYRFDWTPGADNLLVVSVGTGWWRQRYDVDEFLRQSNVLKTKDICTALVQDTVRNHIVTLQALSACRKPWYIDMELGRFEDGAVPHPPLMRFQRYDASLETDAIAARLDPKLTKGGRLKKLVSRLRTLDIERRSDLEQLYLIGYEEGRCRTPGKDGIEADDFPAAFDPEGFAAAEAA
jgi:hypothetical protein